VTELEQWETDGGACEREAFDWFRSSVSRIKLPAFPITFKTDWRSLAELVGETMDPIYVVEETGVYQFTAGSWKLIGAADGDQESGVPAGTAEDRQGREGSCC
jgi:hypothetical protein